MSRLITKGDTTENFGRNLPVPYIERIELHAVTQEEVEEYLAYESARAPPELEEYLDEFGMLFTTEEYAAQFTRIRISVSLMCNTSNDFLFDDFKEEVLEKLYINFFMLNDTELIETFKTQKKELLSVYTGTGGSYSLFLGKKFEARAVTDYGIDVATLEDRDDAYNRFIKVPDLTADFIVYSTNLTDFDWTMFAATSLYDPVDLTVAYNNPIVFAMNFSNVAYEDLVRNGELAYRSQDGYYALDGTFYTGVPVMGLNSRYHKTDEFGLEDIIDGIRVVTQDYKEYQITNKKIDSAIQNIEYIIAKFGEDPDLLIQLHKLSVVFPNATTSTRIGRLYERFKRAVINANALLIEQPEVRKRLIRNVKIQDFRPFRYEPSYGGSYDEDLEPEDLLYQMFLQSNVAKYIEVDEGDEDAEAPMTPESAETVVADAIESIIGDLPLYGADTDDIYLTLRDKFRSILMAIAGEAGDEAERFVSFYERRYTYNY